MALRRRKQSVAALALALAVVLGGCAASVPGSGELSADEIAEKVERTYENRGQYTATLTSTVTTGDEVETTTARIWMDESADKMRYEYVAPESEAGRVLVSNGSVMWSYDPSTGVARKTDVSAFRTSNTTPDYGAVVENLLDTYDVSFEGTETVGDRKTYVVRLEPKANSSVSGVIERQTLWIGQESWFPVKQRSAASFGNESIETVMTYTNLTLDADVPAERFEFDPPADAEVEETETPETTQYDSVAAAEADLPFDVAEPTSLPDGYELDGVSVSSSDDSTSVSLSYWNDSEGLFVSQSPAGDQAAGSGLDGETLSVNGHDAVYGEVGNSHVLRWSCGGHQFGLVGSLSKDDLVEVASSMACE